MRNKVKHILFVFILLIQRGLFSQSGEYKPGDLVKESIDLYNLNGARINLKIPDDNYLICYRYSWKDMGKGIETADSIKLLEEKIAKILADGEMHKLKVVCISYDRKPDFIGWQKSLTKEKPFKPNTKYEVLYFNLNGDSISRLKCSRLLSKITVFGEDGKLLRWSSTISKFNFSLFGNAGFNGTTIKAKLLNDESGNKKPLDNTFVYLATRGKKDTLSEARTDKYGDFELKVPGNMSEYIIRVSPNDKKIKKVLLVSQQGKEISTFEKTDDRFEYKLLKADIVTLSEIQTEDISVKFEALRSSKNKEFTITENIFYETGKSNVETNSITILDKVVKILKDNPSVKLEVISHTDALGDDRSNLTLSEKRAGTVVTYLINKGIEAKRIRAVGKGETEIRNRCTNGVTCSDKENEYNRRTEFKFKKP